jgi:uncharacterized membrane protein YphA (DoxX/SURF4 family)
MSDAVAFARPARSKTIAAWTLQILLAAVFLAAASAKLAGVDMMVQEFEQIGLGQWFRFFTALVEISGAVALLVPGLAAAGAALLGTTMIVAVGIHLTILHTNPAPALVLIMLNAVVLWLRREQVRRILP